ncbi:hypothetical protein Vadar_012405 [Vaccinium darrowii]|uniref:Uncharacterized protein n=1 Tax=Vaccinium darrowii TaxID=229202 RepID=A0ACB7Z3C1_9ERIC|nr:hypothetical protein Vadar_012405 [Vaccinium darrowii]
MEEKEIAGSYWVGRRRRSPEVERAAGEGGSPVGSPMLAAAVAATATIARSLCYAGASSGWCIQIVRSLCCAGALECSSSPDPPSLAEFLNSPERPLEVVYKHIIRVRRSVSMELRNIGLVVAVLIATATFQAVLSPPGGVGGPGDNNLLTNGTSINATISSSNHLFAANTTDELIGYGQATYGDFFVVFYGCNTMAFVLSMLMIMFALSFQPFFPLHLALYFLMLSYGVSFSVISPSNGSAEVFLKVSTVCNVTSPEGALQPSKRESQERVSVGETRIWTASTNPLLGAFKSWSDSYIVVPYKAFFGLHLLNLNVVDIRKSASVVPKRYLGRRRRWSLVPLDPLLLCFLHRLRLAPTQISINTFRIVNSVAELAQRESLLLGIEEILFCYEIVGLGDGSLYYLRARKGFKLIGGLPPKDRCPDDWLKITGEYEYTLGTEVRAYRLPWKEGDPGSQVKKRSHNRTNLAAIETALALPET